MRDPSEDALLAAIRAAPDDNLPRLVYADWLDEHDRPEQAEFIRVQIELTKPGLHHHTTLRLAAREGLLKHQHGAEWFGTLDHTSEYGSDTTFRRCHIDRGFITELGGRLGVFRERADEVERFAPVLDTAHVDYVEAAAAGVFALPLFDRVRCLKFDRVQRDSFRWMCQHAYSSPVRELVIDTGGGDHRDTMVRFVDCDFARGPERLGMNFGMFAENGRTRWEYEEATEDIPHILRAVNLPNLRRFGIWGLDETNAALFAAWPTLAQLDSLDFHLSGAVDEGVRVLLSSPHLPLVRELLFGECHLSDAAAAVIASCAKLTGLQKLDLYENPITGRGVGALSRSPHVPDDLELWIGAEGIGPSTQRRLKRRFRNGRVHLDP